MYWSSYFVLMVICASISLRASSQIKDCISMRLFLRISSGAKSRLSNCSHCWRCWILLEVLVKDIELVWWVGGVPDAWQLSA